MGESLSYPAIQQPLDAALKALAGDRSHRPQDSSDLLQLPPRVLDQYMGLTAPRLAGTMPALPQETVQEVWRASQPFGVGVGG